MSQAVPARFWDLADRLLSEAKLVIDRPKGSRHPRYSHVIYPLDYGYLAGTVSAADGDGIDIWRGAGAEEVTGALCTIDLVKHDSEVKFLIGCSAEEADIVLAFHNSYAQMAAAYLPRG